MPAFFEIKSVSADYDRNVVLQEIFRKSFLRRPSVFPFVIDQLTAEAEKALSMTDCECGFLSELTAAVLRRNTDGL